MAATGLAGHPEEHFNPWHMGEATDFFPDQLIYGPDHVQRQIQKATTSNGVFGTKAQFTQITNFVGLDQLETLFPTPLKYILVERRDTIRQGVSLSRASQTNVFNSEFKEQNPPLYNYHHLWQCIREIRIQAKGWETFFHNQRIEPFRVVYEDLVRDRARFVYGALKFLGISIPPDFQIPETHLKKQADSLSDEWVEKFYRGDQV
jgi:LPS sulfotransferase NodH